MNARHWPFRLTAGAALLLGHASVLWGLAVAPVYFAGFALLAARPIAGLGLSAEIPLIGLGIAGSGLALGLLSGDEPVKSPAVGLILNGIALAFAVGLRALIG